MRTLAFVATFALVACGVQNSSLSSLASDVNAAESENHVFVNEDHYAEEMESLVAPVIAKAETGFFKGEGGVNLFYAKLERPGSKAKIAIVPGYTENYAKYHETIFNFYQSGYSVYFYEHRGMGQSDRLVANDKEIVYVKQFEDYVKDLKTYLTTVVPKDNRPLLVFAHSMGGGITADFLTQNHDLIKAAVLNSPMLGIKTGKYPKAIALTIASGATLIGKGTSYAPGEGPVNFDEWQVETANTSSPERYYRYKEIVQGLGTANGGSSFNWVKEVLLMSYRLGQKWVAARATTPILMGSAALDSTVVNEDQAKYCSAAKACKLVNHPNSRHETYNEIGSIRTPWMTDVIHYFDGYAK